MLIVIDMQNDFIDGALGTPEAEAIVEAVKDKIRSYPPADVIATMDTHEPDYLTTQEGQLLPVEHCIRGTDGWMLRPDIAALLTEAAVYEKPTFGSTKLAEDLRERKGVEEIELITAHAIPDNKASGNNLRKNGFQYLLTKTEDWGLGAPTVSDVYTYDC